LTTSQIPAHSHVPQADNNLGNQSAPAGNVWAQNTLTEYSPSPPDANLDPAALGNAGGSQPHDNRIPFLVINFILSLFGVFPSQS
jgi:microcystin-dependent protein